MRTLIWRLPRSTTLKALGTSLYDRQKAKQMMVRWGVRAWLHGMRPQCAASCWRPSAGLQRGSSIQARQPAPPGAPAAGRPHTSRRPARAAAPCRAVVEGGLRLNHQVLLDQFQMGMARVAQLAVEALQQGEPLLMFCAAGKDRTGLVAALLQLCAGATDEQVAACYARWGEPGQLRGRWARRGAGLAGARGRVRAAAAAAAAVGGGGGGARGRQGQGQGLVEG